MEKSNVTVEQYVHEFPPEIQLLLNKLRNVIMAAAPEAEEGISYGIPAYKFKKRPLVYFGAYKNHIGFYATPSGNEQFAEELKNYKQGRGSVQFPYKQDIPLKLVKRIVEFKVIEINARLKKHKK